MPDLRRELPAFNNALNMLFRGFALAGVTIALLLIGVACESDDGEDPAATPTPVPSPGGPSSDLPGTIAFASDRGAGFDVYTVDAADGTEAQVTNDPSEDREPAWSPDGARIAFQSSRGGAKNIFIMNADGTNPLPIQQGPELQGGPRWSPDGTKIAYYSYLAAEVGFLWIDEVDGPDNYPPLRSIHPAGPDTHCGGGFPGGWLDADTVIFRGSWGEGGALEICSARTDETGIGPLFSERDTFAFYPANSPDGSLIAFTHQAKDQDDQDLFVMSAEGRNARVLFATEDSESYPTWSPDGEWIAFTSDADGDEEIYAVRNDGTDLRKLTDNEYPDLEPAWRPVSP